MMEQQQAEEQQADDDNLITPRPGTQVNKSLQLKQLNESGSKQKSTTSNTAIGQSEEARGREATKKKLFEWGLEKLSTA